MSCCTALVCLWALLGQTPASDVVVVVGAPGSPEFETQFQQWAGRWQTAAERGKARFHAIGLPDADHSRTDRDLVREQLDRQSAAGNTPLYLVLIGHGTFDGKTPRFNLRGDDFSAAELAEWLRPLSRPVAVVNCASSSGPFLNALSGPNRVIVTATRSGQEFNYARFGDHLSAAVLDDQADLDKDQQVSLLEALLLASARVREFYSSEGRLATEHALIDDNGDRLGTPADWFDGVLAVKSAKDGAVPDGLRANQWILIPSDQDAELTADLRARRDELEESLARARGQKSRLSEEQYLALIEPLLLDLARLAVAPAGKMPAVNSAGQ